MRLPLAVLTAVATLAVAASASAANSATSTAPGGQPIPAAITPAGGYYITPIAPAGFTATVCANGGGAVLHRAGGDVCQSKGPINAATKAPAKRDEAKKE